MPRVSHRARPAVWRLVHRRREFLRLPRKLAACPAKTKGSALTYR